VRISLLRSAAVLAVTGVTAVVTVGTAGAADQGAAAPTTTTPAATPTTTTAAATTAAPATTAAAPTTAAGAPTTTVAAGAATTVAGTSAMLPPNASLDQIQTALIGAFGPTTDVVGELAPFVAAAPPAIPTPEGAVVEDLSINYHPDTEDPSFSYYSSSMLFTSTVPAPDLVTFFQMGMPAAGYIQTGDSVENEDGRQVRRFTYDVPAPTSDQDEVQIIIVDESSTTQVDFVQLEIMYGLDPSVVQIFAGWPGTLPLLEGATLDDVGMNTFNFGGDISLTLNNRYNVPVPYADAFTQFEAGLAGTGYTIDPESDPTEGYFDITGGELGEATIFLSEGFPEGTTTMSIDSSFDIVT
jgi:hypothetical protein